MGTSVSPCLQAAPLSENRNKAAFSAAGSNNYANRRQGLVLVHISA